MLIFDRESLKIVRSKPLPSALLDQELSNATSHYILRPKRQEPRAFKSIMYLPAGWENMCIFRCIKKKKNLSRKVYPSRSVSPDQTWAIEKNTVHNFMRVSCFFLTFFDQKKHAFFCLGFMFFSDAKNIIKNMKPKQKKVNFFLREASCFGNFLVSFDLLSKN